jgi:hypothetical protein
MTSRWIALHCSDDAQALITNHPNAFLLLTQISMRVKWKDCKITRLKAGQAFIGDWKNAGISSEKAYRHAKGILADFGLVSFQGASKGTTATLLDQGIYSYESKARGGQGADEGRTEGGQGADEGRTEGGRGATNHTDTRTHGNTDYTENPENTDHTHKDEREYEADHVGFWPELLKEESPKKDVIAPIFEKWATMEGVPKITTITESRKKLAHARMKEPFFRENWIAGMDAIRQSPFLTGKNDRGWKADIDWFLRPDSLPKILEGKYETQKTGFNGIVENLKLRVL